MAIAKVIEVMAEGSSIEDAVKDAVSEAGDTVRNIQSVYVKEIHGVVENGKVTRFRVNTKVTFMVDGTRQA